MTQLTETLYSTIVHEFHNGGVKSSYGLNAYTRKALLRDLLSSKGCNCINCLCDTDNTAQQGVSLDNVSPIRYNSIHNELTKEEKMYAYNTQSNSLSKWDTIQGDVADAYAYLDEEETEQPPVDDFDDEDDEQLAKLYALTWEN